jgi:hypothetical protein
MRVVDVHIHWSPKSLMAEQLASLPSPDAKLTRYAEGVPVYTCTSWTAIWR